MAPPNQRSEDDFDFGAMHLMPESVDYVRYFTSHIYQFQFLKALCAEAGEYGEGAAAKKPLHKCNLYGTFDNNSIPLLLCRVM